MNKNILRMMEAYLKHDEGSMRVYQADGVLGLSRYYSQIPEVFRFVSELGPRVVKRVVERPSVVSLMRAGFRYGVAMFGYLADEPLGGGERILRVERTFDRVGFTLFSKKGYFERGEVIGTTVLGVQDVNDTGDSYNRFKQTFQPFLDKRRIHGFEYMVEEDRLGNSEILAVRRWRHLEGATTIPTLSPSTTKLSQTLIKAKEINTSH